MKEKVVFDKILGKLYFPENDEMIAPKIENNGVWEPEEVNWILNNVNDGMVCVNVGANVGYHALLFSKMVGEYGKVYAFEPVSYIYDFLIKNINDKKINNIVAVKKAVGNKNGKVDVYINSSNCGDNRCFDPTNITDIDGNYIDHGFSEIPTKENADLVTIDKYFKNEKIDVIFSDAQGFDIFVLQGAMKTIYKNKPKIVVEFAYDWLDQINVDYTTIINELTKDLYDMYCFYNNKMIKMSDFDKVFKIIKLKKASLVNLYFIPKDMH